VRGRAGAVLYTRRSCPLCFALGRLAERSSRRHGVGLVVTDVDADPELLERYSSRVPVLDLPGGKSLSGGAGARDVDEAFAGAADFLRNLEGPVPDDREGGNRSSWSPLAWLRRALGPGGGRPGGRTE
jgi:glutaredoxin